MDAMSQADVMKTPEEILTLYQQMLAAIVQSSEDAIVSKNLDGIITSWNPGAEKLFGYPMEEMIGRHITTIIPPERLDEEPRMIEMVKRGERVLPFDTIRMRKDGQRVHISLTLSPIRDIDGKIVGVSKIARDITLQKKLNDDLLQSENRLRLATEAGAMGIWDWDVVNEEMVWDGRSKEFFGLGPQATLNYATYLSAIHPDDRSRVEEELRKLFDSSNEGEYDTEYRTIGIEDRKIRWIKAKGTTFYNNGQPYRITGTLQDITSQKQSEQQLKESEERLRMAIQATKLGTWDYRPKTNELYWSDECRKIYDLPPHVTISYALFEEHVHPDDKELASSAISKAMDPGGDGTYDIQYRILRYSDKKPRWIKAQGKVYFDPTGVPELFIGTVLDFSAEKVKEQELKDSISLFQRMADTVPVIIWTTRADGYCNYLNEFWYNYTGQTPDKALGFGWLDAVHPDDRAESGKIFLDANELKKSFSLIYRVRGKNGEFRWMMNAARPRFDFDGKYEGLTGVVVDIHERKQAEEALRESEYRLNMALETAEMGTYLVHQFLVSG